jgi:hypothetical protein
MNSLLLNSLVLPASAMVLLGFLWLLGFLVHSAHSGTSITWWHIAITAVLCAASAGLIVYMIL